MRSILIVFLIFIASTGHANEVKRIALSFDDVPRHAGAFFTPDERSKRLIAALKESEVEQAGFFVTTGNLKNRDGQGGEQRISAYVEAGHVIANHSTTHSWLSQMSVADYVNDIDQAEAWLIQQPGRRAWFRFPYLDEGGKDSAKRDQIRAALRERGLLNAYITVDSFDWHLDSLASQAKRDLKEMNMNALRELYVETLVQVSNFYNDIAIKDTGRSPAHVMLLHETDLAALYIADLVTALRQDGWGIISMDEAYADPIAVVEPQTWFLSTGRVAAMAHESQTVPEADLVHERISEDVLNQLFNSRVLVGD